MALSRPYVDPSVCEPVAATEGAFDDLELTPFWIWTDEPIAIQVLGDPALGPIGPFAVLLRYPEQIAEMNGRHIETVNDWPVAIVTSPNGNGDALWQLPDGSEAYLRTRDLDRTQIVAIVEQLQPRAADAPIPGFDFGRGSAATGEIEMLAEHMNSGLQGQSASLACRSYDNPLAVWRVTALDADPVVEYIYILDRPRPVDVGFVDGTVIVIGHGFVTGSTPSAAEVTNADPDVWAALLTQPFP
jgi:hypothetical protein